MSSDKKFTDLPPEFKTKYTVDELKPILPALQTIDPKYLKYTVTEIYQCVNSLMSSNQFSLTLSTIESSSSSALVPSYKDVEISHQLPPNILMDIKEIRCYESKIFVVIGFI